MPVGTNPIPFLARFGVLPSAPDAELPSVHMSPGPKQLTTVVYRYAGKALILTIAGYILRLYFLPARFALPPADPPPSVTSLETVFEVPPPKELQPQLIKLDDDHTHHTLIVRCTKDQCQGRWKPARARHCSECGRCRVGFDHHCMFVSGVLSSLNLGIS